MGFLKSIGKAISGAVKGIAKGIGSVAKGIVKFAQSPLGKLAIGIGLSFFTGGASLAALGGGGLSSILGGTLSSALGSLSGGLGGMLSSGLSGLMSNGVSSLFSGGLGNLFSGVASNFLGSAGSLLSGGGISTLSNFAQQAFGSGDLLKMASSLFSARQAAPQADPTTEQMAQQNVTNIFAQRQAEFIQQQLQQLGYSFGK